MRKDHKIKKVMDIFTGIIGFDGAVLWDLSKPDGIMNKLQIPEILKYAGWELKISLEEGLSYTIN